MDEGGDDPFGDDVWDAALLGDDSSSAPREPSFEERQAAYARLSRWEALDSFERRQRHDHKRNARRRRWRARRPVLAFAAALALIIGLAVWVDRANSSDTVDQNNSDTVMPMVGDVVGAPPPSQESTTPLGTPPRISNGGLYKFIATQLDGEKPVAYDPCRPIHYVENVSGAPAGTRSLLRQAIKTIETATGLRFIDDGLTKEPITRERSPYQPTRYAGRWAPVLISWSTAAKDSELKGGVLGYSGSFPYNVAGKSVYVSGRVVLDGEDAQAYLDRGAAHGPEIVQSIMEHELGHIVGLDHVDDELEMMNPFLSRTTLGPGDRRGLAAVGGGECFPGI